MKLAKALALGIVSLSILLCRLDGAFAVSRGDFAIKTARQLAELCSADPKDSDYIAAIHFCEGFLVGAYGYHLATLQGPDTRKVICLPDPMPSRDRAAADFSAWVASNPDDSGLDPVEAQFRWLVATWPCK